MEHTKGGIARSRGAQHVAANFDRAKLDAVDWSAIPKSFGRLVMQSGTWGVVVTKHIQEAAAYVNSANRIIALNPTTWRTISFRPETQADFVRSMSGGASGMKFIAMDSGPYGEAARLEAARDAAVTGKKDALDELSRQAQSLIVQASGLAGGASQYQMRIFAERYAELQTHLEEVEGRLLRVRSLVDLAGDTVMEACG